MYDQAARKLFLKEKGYEHRTTPWRTDIAADTLEGVLSARRYKEGRYFQCVVPFASLRFEPWASSPVEDQLLFGELFLVYDIDRETGLAWGKAQRDGHVGFVALSSLSEDVRTSTHWVASPFTPVLPAPDRKADPYGYVLGLNSLVTVDAYEDVYAKIGENQWVFMGDLLVGGQWASDMLAPILPLAGVSSYMWGYRNSLAYDCSGLTQAGHFASGVHAPRDADQQENDARLGTSIPFEPDLTGLKRLDQVYWPGHLAIMVDETNAIHARGGNVRRVVIEPVAVIDLWRKTEESGPARLVKRLA